MAYHSSEVRTDRAYDIVLKKNALTGAIIASTNRRAAEELFHDLNRTLSLLELLVAEQAQARGASPSLDRNDAEAIRRLNGLLCGLQKEVDP